MTKVRLNTLIAVYSETMPKKSREIRRFLKETGVLPLEEHKLGDYNPEDSPEDVGILHDGTFFSYSDILKHGGSIKQALRREKESALADAM